MNTIKRKTIEGTIDKASKHLQTARDHLKSLRYSEAIETAQECIELSVKSILSLLDIKYSPSHEWAPDKKQFAAIAKQIQERQLLDKLDKEFLSSAVALPRLLLLMNFWAQFYLTAKYGFEVEHLASARDLFKMEDAELAVKHADQCYQAVLHLRHIDEEKLADLAS